MPKPISVEEREKIVKHKQNNENEADIARWLFVSESSLTKLWARYRKTGSYLPNYENCGRKPVLNDTQTTQIKTEIEKNPRHYPLGTNRKIQLTHIRIWP